MKNAHQWHKEYIELEISKFKKLREKTVSLGERTFLNSIDLYPEFRLRADEHVGFFNPFIVGNLKDSENIGKGSSILTTLPFYERIITKVIPISKNEYENFYGVNFEDFQYLIDAGKILPLLPWYLHHSYYTSPHDDVAYLQALYKEGWPSDDRHWLVLRDLTMFGSAYKDSVESIVGPFTRIAIKGGNEIFHDTSVLQYFIKLCNRLIYRGEPLLIFNYLDLSREYKKNFQLIGIKEWALLTISILDIFDNFFSPHFIAPNSSPNYSEIGFAWLCNHLGSMSEKMDMLRKDPSKFKLDRSILANIYKSSRSIPIEHYSLLRKHFLYEPIESVSSIKKFVHWLEHSSNVKENQKVLNIFSKHLLNRKYKAAIDDNLNSFNDILFDLNKEVRKVSFDIKVCRTVIQIGGVIGSALAGASIGNALSTGDLESLFAMCGALAASAFISNISKDITNTASKLVYRNNFAFLVWKKQSK